MQLNGSALNVEELNGGTSLLTLELGTAAFTFVASTVQTRWTLQLQQSSLDFSRQVFQMLVLNNLGVVAFDFVSLGMSAAEGVTFGLASFGAVNGNVVQLAITNNLAAGALDLTGQPTGQAAAVNLTATTFDFVGQDVSEVRTVALSPAVFDFVGQTATPGSVVALSAPTFDFVPLDITPANAPLGTVIDLTTTIFNFVQNDVRGMSSITFDPALFTSTPTDVQNNVFMSLTASDLKMTPQSLTVVQMPVVIELTTALFNFTPRSVQLTGLSSAGDRKRMLFGVGR